METGWTTADYALILSIASVFISISGFVWSVWSKFVFPKPQAKITAARCFTDIDSNLILSEDYEGRLPGDWTHDDVSHPAIAIEVTNFGPGKIFIKGVIARKSRFRDFGNRATGFLHSYTSYPSDLSLNGPVGGNLPRILEESGYEAFYIPASIGLINDQQLIHFGVIDSLGRRHYAKRRDIKAIVKSLRDRPVQT